MSTASGDDYLVAESPALAAVERTRTTQWPFILVATLVLAGLGLIAVGRVQQGVAGMVVAFGLAAVLRLVLPVRTAGWLASRSRIIDASAFGLLSAGLAATIYLLK
jgi:hypothetical protein